MTFIKNDDKSVNRCQGHHTERAETEKSLRHLVLFCGVNMPICYNAFPIESDILKVGRIESSSDDPAERSFAMRLSLMTLGMMKDEVLHKSDADRQRDREGDRGYRRH